MKRFLVTFLAALFAIIATLAGIVFIAQYDTWTRRRDDLLTQLVQQERKHEQCVQAAANHVDDDAVDITAADVAHTKTVLVKHYADKLWMCSSKERQQIKRWNDEVAAFNGRKQKTRHEPFSVQDFPTIPPLHPTVEAPPYPYEIREKGLFGNGYAKAWFDESGHCSNVVMTVSTGSGLLDVNTITFGQAHWVGRPNTSIDIPITYKFQ